MSIYLTHAQREYCDNLLMQLRCKAEFTPLMKEYIRDEGLGCTFENYTHGDYGLFTDEDLKTDEDLLFSSYIETSEQEMESLIQGASPFIFCTPMFC